MWTVEDHRVTVTGGTWVGRLCAYLAKGLVLLGTTALLMPWPPPADHG
jgi:hypothetical protein